MSKGRIEIKNLLAAPNDEPVALDLTQNRLGAFRFGHFNVSVDNFSFTRRKDVGRLKTSSLNQRDSPLPLFVVLSSFQSFIGFHYAFRDRYIDVVCGVRLTAAS